jgi:hypothetical protein
MSTQPAPVLELAVFTVREPDSFPAIQRQTHEAVATLSGHRAGLRLRGLRAPTSSGGLGSPPALRAPPNLFADLVVWDSLEAATRASNQVREDPRFAPLMTSLAELKLYAHYRLVGDPSALLAELRGAPVVEVAAYAVRDVAAQLEVHGRVHEALRALAGHRGGAPARQVEDPSQFADLIGWEHREAHQRAGAALQARADLGAFFSGLAEMKVFELFSVLG